MGSNFAGKVARRLRRIDQQLRPGALFERNCRFLLYHRPEGLSAEPAVSAAPSTIADGPLVDRIVAAYARASQADLGDSMWKMFFSTYHAGIHRTLVEGKRDAVAALLRNPAQNDLFYGFDILTRAHHSVFRSGRVRSAYARLCLDGLVRFAEAVGAIRMDNPETWAAGKEFRWTAQDLIAALDRRAIRLTSPNPYPLEHGFSSSAGVIPIRAPQALYQAWRIRQLVQGIANPRVLEIGAGLGRTAYYAYELGIKDYTIVDIPLSTAAQAYFLGRTLGEQNVRLDGEAGEGGAVRIINPKTFMDEAGRFDLVVNVDSLPEMDRSIAQAYWEKIKLCTPLFLSINHEANAFSVADLVEADASRVSVERRDHWMRRGYAEELIRIGKD
jgi:SAM-dependent methyltransferase